LKVKLEKLEQAYKKREDNLGIATTTSKTNYNDPRITVAWCKRLEVPIEKIFPKTLLDKFNWSMVTESNWTF
jgi:DNA topoisomerase-1